MIRNIFYFDRMNNKIDLDSGSLVSCKTIINKLSVKFKYFMDSLKECLIVFTNNFTARPLTDPMTVQGMNLVVGGNVQRFLVQWSGSVHIRPPTRHCRIEKSCDSPETNVAIFQVRKKQKKKKNRKELRKECKGARENGRKGRREGVKKEINLDSRSSQDIGGEERRISVYH